MKKTLFTGSAIVLSSLPFLALAQSSYSIQDKIIAPLSQIVSSLVPILMTLALVAFIWGLVKYIMAAGDPAGKAEGKNIMIGGVVALFVMASVWGLTSAIGGALGLNNGNAPTSSNLIPK